VAIQLTIDLEGTHMSTALLSGTVSPLGLVCYLLPFAVTAALAVALQKFIPETLGRALVNNSSEVAVGQAHGMGSRP
jgi:hypothetical protein